MFRTGIIQQNKIHVLLGRCKTGDLIINVLIASKLIVCSSFQNCCISGDFFHPTPLTLAYIGNGVIFFNVCNLLLFLRISFIGLIMLECFGRNCARYITQPINDLIPLAIISIGRDDITLIWSPEGLS